MKLTKYKHNSMLLETPRSSNISDIEAGDVVTFYYAKSENNKNPLCLVLNPEGPNHSLHALVFDYMTDNEIKTLSRSVSGPNKNISIHIKENCQSKEYETYYDDFIAGNLKKIKQNVYRTFDKHSISALKKVKFKYE